MSDPVNHPNHYRAGQYEAIDVLDAFIPDNPHLWNAGKYLLRAGKKDDLVQDLRKAVVYIERAISKAEQVEPNIAVAPTIGEYLAALGFNVPDDEVWDGFDMSDPASFADSIAADQETQSIRHMLDQPTVDEPTYGDVDMPDDDAAFRDAKGDVYMWSGDDLWIRHNGEWEIALDHVVPVGPFQEVGVAREWQSFSLVPKRVQVLDAVGVRWMWHADFGVRQVLMRGDLAPWCNVDGGPDDSAGPFVEVDE